MKDNLNFKTICPLKQKEQTARITYENNYELSIYPGIGVLAMEEQKFLSISSALQNVGMHSMICFEWEIYKLLFILHNVKPVWIEVNTIIDENYFKVFIV